MAERRLSILLALADRERAEDFAIHLAEEHGMIVTLAGELDPEDHAVEHYDAVLAAEPVDDETPHVILDDGTAGEPAADNVFAVLPRSAGDALVGAALRLAAAGYRVSQAAPARTVPGQADDLQRSNGSTGLPAARFSGSIVLTQREKQVVALLAEGASNKLIARRLGISVHTAKFHVAAILQKLGAVNRTDAIAIAMREGLILV